MTTFPWLTTLGLIPLVGALAVAFMGRAPSGRIVALGVSLVTLTVSVGAALQFNPSSPEQFQLTELHPWIPQWGISYALGVDGMALALIVMGAILVPVCILAAWDDVPEGGTRQNRYFAWMLFLEAMIVGVFAATDVVLFYVFFEVMLIPVFFLIGSYGGPGRRAAAMKFLLFSLTGGLVMLVAVLALFPLGPGGDTAFLVSSLTGLKLDPGIEMLLFCGFFIAFAIKAPMWPVHTWLPEASTESRPATAVLLVGVLDKVGTFGMIRFCLQMFPEASKQAAPYVIALAVISILYGAVLAIGSNDIMRFIAYTSISHFGFIILGIFAFTPVAGSGSVLYMVNHGFSTAGLFLVAGMLISRGGSKYRDAYGGWQRVTPVLAGAFLISGLSTLALPGLGSFVSEYMVLVGSYATSPIAAVIAATALILAAVYVLITYQRIFTGARPTDRANVPDLTVREKWVVAPIIVAFLLLGFYPKVALDVVNPSVTQTMSVVGVATSSTTAPSIGSDR
ncbi:NADH-quinone oxidoreductase subunit M [Dermatophilus congolensis]|uniref:NADH-quinone oxidoreductase subunit M n=1 Tax=Dermatophilus congolensis TaxID=1863 RepID=A0AA46BNR4_9MICO|nr:NADH-quinone oxidoreductase subunit M [Dermatophilus congolensis]MBO3143235.1 NADH-quinone oxidoreductase subunit M [Dermatophilus congolensis]MBO3152219.1 NADH-quinone oxidoreductase subunit M [Dermatophilus congolensis]MBO3160768.1 NADH-quinone oxidoreductase subunit M [Dermatophilus congolensis]MBO3163510.1 NADH-quinone oxidoreductase subunit M [Dermatophilus congolensis]MBO3177056.1 NADH-quinone oxidoreductase subunit M [Dermatophilus congolensis]